MSSTLTPIRLPLVAERIRKQIKAMIPEATTGDSGEQLSEQAERLPTEIEGGIMYGGSLLAKRISELVRAMGTTDIGKVGENSHGLVT